MIIALAVMLIVALFFAWYQERYFTRAIKEMKEQKEGLDHDMVAEPMRPEKKQLKVKLVYRGRGKPLDAGDPYE